MKATPPPPEAMAGSKRPAVQKPRTPVTVDVLTRSIPLPQEFSLALSAGCYKEFLNQTPADCVCYFSSH